MRDHEPVYTGFKRRRAEVISSVVPVWAYPLGQRREQPSITTPLGAYGKDQRGTALNFAESGLSPQRREAD
jgi:hypothetical protein